MSRTFVGLQNGEIVCYAPTFADVCKLMPITMPPKSATDLVRENGEVVGRREWKAEIDGKISTFYITSSKRE